MSKRNFEVKGTDIQKKVSAAIRDGLEAMPGLQKVEGFLFSIKDDKICGVCAEGAALVGIYGLDVLNIYYEFLGFKPSSVTANPYGLLSLNKSIASQLSSHVVYKGIKQTLESAIWAMNDDNELTLPQIADEVERLGY